jgi:hypothetical protein
MSVTLEEARIMEQRHGLPAHRTLATAAMFREHGAAGGVAHSFASVAVCSRCPACAEAAAASATSLWLCRRASAGVPEEHRARQVRLQRLPGSLAAEDAPPATRHHRG